MTTPTSPAPIKASNPLSQTIQIVSVSALIALTGIAGCSKSDDAQAAVKQAERSFSTVAAGDSTASASFAEATYKETEQLVAPHAGSEDGYAEAAAVSSALAKLGQASLASSQASKIETQSLLNARVVRGMINQWLTMSAIEQAAGLFDPSAELAEINNLITLRQGDVKAYTKERKEVETRIATLESQVEDLRTKSAAERNESGALELQMPRVSAAKAAKIVVQVREHTLKADNYELEAIRIEGVVGQLRPGANEIQLNVEKASSQIELLEQARIELAQREKASKADATQAANAATQAAATLKDAVAQYAEFRSSQVDDANQRAIALTRSSIGALRDANRAVKQVAQLTKASAQQSLAESYSRQATGHAEAALLYQALIEANVPGSWQTLAQEAQALAAQSRQDANDAYQAAASALRSARVTGDEKDKIEATAQRLEALGGLEPEPDFDDMENMNNMDMDHSNDMDMENMDHSNMDMDSSTQDDG